MSNHITATLNSRACISAQVTLRTGAEASTATVVLDVTNGAALRPGKSALVLADATSRTELKQLDILAVYAGGGLVRADLADKRRGWGARVTGERKGRTLASLVNELLALLGEPRALRGLKRGGEIAPLQRWDNEPAGLALEHLLAQFGQGYTVATDGRLEAVSADIELPAGAVVLECEAAPVVAPTRVDVIGSAALAELSLEGDWTLACADETGAVRPLADVLADWSLDDADVRAACLVEGGLRAITTPERAALLEAHAYKSYRVPDSELARLPLIAARVAHDGALVAPLVEHTGYRAKLRNVTNLADPWETETALEPKADAFTFDATTGVLTFERVTGHLEPRTPPVHDTRLEGRVLAGPAQIRLTLAGERGSAGVLFSRITPGSAGRAQIQRGELFTVTTTGTGTSAATNTARASAAAIAALFARALPSNNSGLCWLVHGLGRWQQPANCESPATTTAL